MRSMKAGSLALQVLISALLGACASGGGGGGGGGDGGGPISPLPPPPPSGVQRPPAAPLPPLPPAAVPGSFPSSSSSEYQNNWAIEGVNADAAWQFENAHGEGVLVGVIDDGMVAPDDPNYAELAGRIDPRSKDIRAARNQLSSSNTHGAELASLIAGNDNGALTVGVAYESTILAVRADNGAGTFNTDDLAAAIDFAVAEGVKVINLSLGSGNPSGSAFQAAIQRATQAGVIIVASAGNDGRSGATQPNYPGLLATNSSVSNGLIVIAGGINSDGSFNPTSNPAGSAASSYIVAPGWEIIVPDFGTPGPLAGFQRCYPGGGTTAPCASGMVQIQGTSYASPITAGAVAVLMSAFPGLTPQQVVTLLLQSSDDMGPAGIDGETGWGRLNLARAFQPVGTVSTPLAFGMPEVSGHTLMGLTGPAFGDGLTDDAGEWAMSGFDALGRTYRLDLSRNWIAASSGPALAAHAPSLWRTERSAGGAVMQFAQADDIAPESYRLPAAREDLERSSVRIDAEIAPGLSVAFASNGALVRDVVTSEAVGHLAFVGSEESLRLTRRIGEHLSLSLISEHGQARVGLMQQRSDRSAAATQARFTFDGGALGVTYGAMSEGRGLLGFAWADTLGETPGSETRFAGFSGEFQPTARWRLSFEAELGAADLAQSASWLSLAAPLRTTAFSAEARYALAPSWLEGRGALVLSIAQPLRVEQGMLTARLPTATNYGRRSLAFEDRDIDVTPSGRELRLGVGYRYFESDHLSAFTEALYVLEPGHIALAEPDAMLRLGLRVRR